MNRVSSSISKYLPFLFQSKTTANIFETSIRPRSRLYLSTSCTRPAIRALGNPRIVCGAEFGTSESYLLFGFHRRNTHSAGGVISSSKKSTMGSLDSVADVDIDSDGKFKYILIEIKKEGQKKTIVRGYKWAGYHDDIFQQVSGELDSQDITCSCPGGGRIEHNSKDQTLFVYGYSVGFGKANHEIAVEKLKAKYPSYKITWSDEGY